MTTSSFPPDAAMHVASVASALARQLLIVDESTQPEAEGVVALAARVLLTNSAVAARIFCFCILNPMVSSHSAQSIEIE